VASTWVGALCPLCRVDPVRVSGRGPPFARTDGGGELARTPIRHEGASTGLRRSVAVQGDGDGGRASRQAWATAAGVALPVGRGDDSGGSQHPASPTTPCRP